MTRKEQIEEAANQCEAEDHWNVNSFIIGAEWADANPVITDIFRSLDRAHQAEETVESLKYELERTDMALIQQGIDYGHLVKQLQSEKKLVIEAIKSALPWAFHRLNCYRKCIDDCAYKILKEVLEKIGEEK